MNLATKQCARLNHLRFFREAATLQGHRGRFSLRIARFLGHSTHFGRHKASIYALFRSVSRCRFVAGHHHGHREVGACLANGANQLAAHLFNGTEHMFNARPRLGNTQVAPLLAFGQRLIPVPLALDVVAVSSGFQLGLPLRTGVALVGEHVPVGVGRVEHRVEMPAVVCRGGIGFKLADHLVALVHVDGQLVAVMALAMLPGPGRIQVLLPPLGWLPVRRHGFLLDLFLVFLREMLLRRRHQGRVDDLVTTGNVALLQQLPLHAIEQGFRPGFADAVLEGPDRGAVRDARRIR